MKNKTIILIGIFLALILLLLTVYRFSIYKDDNTLKTLSVAEEKKDNNDPSGKTDKELYSISIITKTVTSYDYELIVDDEGIIGKVYIGEDKYLYITNTKNNSSYKVSDIKFNTLYRNEYYDGILTLYALSNEGKIYYLLLSNLDITKAELKEIATNFKITNFTTLQFKTIDNITLSNIIVLSDSNKMYEARTGIRYNNLIVSLREKYYIYDDNTIANSYGNMIKDGNNNYLKIKYYIEFYDGGSPFDNVSSLIITEDNKLIYTNEAGNNINIYNKGIKNLKYNVEDKNYNKIKVNIIFDDNTNMEFTGNYTDYYGF